MISPSSSSCVPKDGDLPCLPLWSFWPEISPLFALLPKALIALEGFADAVLAVAIDSCETGSAAAAPSQTLPVPLFSATMDADAHEVCLQALGFGLSRKPLVSLPKLTTPEISARIAASLGRRASNRSATRGRPPVISFVLIAPRGRRARITPASTFSPSNLALLLTLIAFR